jgi:hypothetical protein
MSCGNSGVIGVQLIARDGTEMAHLQVDPAKIAEAACVTYDGRYFVYNGLGEPGSVKFGEVSAPVQLGDEHAVR